MKIKNKRVSEFFSRPYLIAEFILNYFCSNKKCRLADLFLNK